MSLELFTLLRITLLCKFITSPLLQQNVNGVRTYFWLQHFGENQTTAILRSKWPCVLSPATPAAMTLMIFMIDVYFFTLSHFFPQWAVNMFERDAFMWSQNKQKSSPRNECDIPWKQKRAIHFIVAKDCEGFSKHVGVNPAWVSLAEQHLDLVEID